MTAAGLLVEGRAEDVLADLAAGRLPRVPAGPLTFAYLDPPFRPEEAFPERDARAAASAWSAMLAACLDALAAILAPAGTVCVHVDEKRRSEVAMLLARSFSAAVCEAGWERDPVRGEFDRLLFVGAGAASCGRWETLSARDTGSRADALREADALFGRAGRFPHPKPMRLAERLIGACTRPGDVVVEAFAGSATFAAAAHRMGRSWMAIEADARTIRRFTATRLSAVGALETAVVEARPRAALRG